MNSLDMVLVSIMAIALIISTLRGGVREAFSLFAVAAGFVFASNFYDAATMRVVRLTSHTEINDIISFLSIFFLTAFIISFIGGRISGLVNKTGLRLINTLAGTALGALKGLLVCVIIVSALVVFMPENTRIFTQSKSFPYVSLLGEALSPIAPRPFREELIRKLEMYKAGGEADKADNKPDKKAAGPGA